MLLWLSFFALPLLLQSAESPSTVIAREEISANPIQANDDTPENRLIQILTGEIQLPTLIELGIARNPSVRIAKAGWRVVIEKYPQVTALPDPMIRYDYFGDSVETRVGPQKQRFGFSQSLPFPGTLHAAGEVILKDIAIAHLQYEQSIRDFIVDMKLSYFELSYLQRAITLTQQNQELMQQVLRVTTTQYTKNEAKYNDVLKAESQLAQLSYDLILLQELTAVEEVKIMALLDLPARLSFGELKAGSVVFSDIPIDKLELMALEKRQEISIAGNQVAKSQAAITLARKETLPKFSIDLMTIDTGEALNPTTPDNGKDPWSIGFGITIPWWINKNRSHIREAEYKQEVAVETQRQLENTTRSGIAGIYFRMENARRLIELYEKTLIPQSEKAMEIAEIWQRDNVKDISGFLETQSVWLNFNLARLRALTDYLQYQARMERMVGGSLRDLEEEKSHDE